MKITGILLNPISEPSEATIRVEALSSKVTITGSIGEITTGSDGSYDFTIVEGIHRIEINYIDEYVVTGKVDVPTGIGTITLPQLLTDYAVVE